MTPSAAATTPAWHRRAADFLRTPEGHSALLGFLGAAMIMFGGFGAGSVRREDPLLESMHLSWLRFGHGSILSAAIVWIGVLCMIGAWARLGRSALRGDVGLRGLRFIVPLWTFPLLFAVPMFSRDAYSYLAQGALLRDGFDPYEVGPVVNPGILLDNVSNVWTTTTTPYGPVHLLLTDAIVRLTGDNVIAGTMLLRITMLPGLALMVWGVPHLARKLGGNPAIALWLAVLNPLVLIHLIGGVHNEMLMVGLMVAGIALALERKHMFGIGLIAFAVAIKATAGVALPFIVWIWMIHEREDAAAQGTEAPNPIRSFIKTAGSGFAMFVVVLGSTSLIAGVGLGWTTALSGSNKIINWLSLPTLVAELSTAATSWLTGNHFDDILQVTRLVSAVVLIGIIAFVWWRFRTTERDAVMGIVIVMVAIVILSPAALPWYYSWPLAVAAGFALSPTTLAILVGLSSWLMLIFQPDGSIGMYSFPHVVLATFASVVGAMTLRTEDPLRLRGHAPEKVPAEATSTAR